MSPRAPAPKKVGGFFDYLGGSLKSPEWGYVVALFVVAFGNRIRTTASSGGMEWSTGLPPGMCRISADRLPSPSPDEKKQPFGRRR